MDLQVQALNLFPTLVFYVPNFLTSEQCKAIIACALKTCEFVPHGALTNNALSSHAYDEDEGYKWVDIHNKIDQLPECKDFIANIMNVLSTYEKSSGMFTGRAINNSWINIQNKGSKLQRHTHPGSFVSGAIYLYVDDDSSKIHFYNPNPYIAISSVHKETPYSVSSCDLKPKIGDLVLFPSWLSHDSGPDANQTEGRTILSFNTF